ncbi:MAG TPA: small acid-soluble spore protein SspJ [Bacillales bacterium]|nr:small acid-soluble spore protein SspJ [Bacillales bacterium]HEU5141483.1 small acid-soluble spore protein SspJ [Bacillales bacterium]
MDWFKNKKDKTKEKAAKEGALNEAEQALDGDPLQEAVKKNQKKQR